MVRVAGLAARQFGVVARRQIDRLGVSDTVIAGWLRTGYLFRRLPGVYSVGHLARSVEADLTAALLYAGPGAMLSHRTGARWWGLIAEPAREIDVSTPRHCRSRPGITIHDRRDLPRVWHNNLPVTPVARTLLDLAAAGLPETNLRKALAEAEYRDWLDVDTLGAHLGRGVPGSRALARALAHHEPRLAMTRSELEDRFLALCARARLPLPECNREVAGLLVDAVWRAERVVVELDGRAGHHTWAQMVRDHRRDVVLRGAGFAVRRYVWAQLRDDAPAVEADIASALRAAA